MASNEYDKKLKRIKDYFKREKLFFDMYLENYEGYYIYIRIDYYKKIKGYKLSWFDLDLIDINNMEKSISSEWIFDTTIDSFNELINKIDTSKEYKYDDSEGRVTINIDGVKKYSASFYKFIPFGLSDISNIIFTIFNSLPRRLETFLFELHALLFDTVSKYEYKEQFSFDLFNDDLTSIFKNNIISLGKKYHEENRVSFLEKIGDRYFAIVDEKQTYVIVIDYNEKEKIVKFYCSCPCEFNCKHIYAVIEAIRNKEFKAFYKISYVRAGDDLFERIMNFGYVLCLSIVGEYFLVINQKCELELVSILEEDGSCNWKVFDEDENETISKKIEEILNNK